jgi:hypothetical protein
MRNGKNGTVHRIAASLVCLTVAAIGLTNQSAAAPVPVLTAGSDTVHVGDIFVIPISIANVSGLTSYQFDLAFNPGIIKALSFTDIGTDFDTAATAGGGSLTGITGFIDNTTGLLSGVADSISGLVTGNGLTPGGTMVDIDFEALAVGISPLTLSNAFLTDNGMPLSSANGDFVLQNGQVTVFGSAAVPEPGTLVLLSLALVFLFSLHQGKKMMNRALLAIAAIAAMTSGNNRAGAQTFSNGPYYATPSWDQQIPAPQRFIVLSNWNSEAVLDRETGLVWQRSPDRTNQQNDWGHAIFGCNTLGAGGPSSAGALPTGNRLGWRLPNLQELASLVDPTQSNPALPAGHPFQDIQNAEYWTATTYEESTDLAYFTDFGTVAPDVGRISVSPKTSIVHLYWCVRGGANVANPPY